MAVHLCSAGEAARQAELLDSVVFHPCLVKEKKVTKKETEQGYNATMNSIDRDLAIHMPLCEMEHCDDWLIRAPPPWPEQAHQEVKPPGMVHCSTNFNL